MNKYEEALERAKEDEMIYQHCLTILHDYGYDSWLKSLRLQKHWKPSEEQIGALNYAYCELFKRGENGEGHRCVHPLMTLIDELKAL